VKKLQYDNELEKKLYKIHQNSILHDKSKQQIKILKNYQMGVLDTIEPSKPRFDVETT